MLPATETDGSGLAPVRILRIYQKSLRDGILKHAVGRPAMFKISRLFHEFFGQQSLDEKPQQISFF